MEQINQHTNAAAILERIKDTTLQYLATHGKASEWEVKEYILAQYRTYNVKTFLGTPIVAFRESSDNPHYFPEQRSAKILQPNSLIMIDIWARVNKPGAPFADITWMAFSGRLVPPQVNQIYSLVIEAREACVHFIQSELKRGNMPLGNKADRAAREVIQKGGYGSNFIHSTGHSIGTTSPHGRYGGLRRTNNQPLQINIGYTIEPGVYLPKEFGVRSEIDFYINQDYKLVITTPVQGELTHTNPENV